MSKPLENKTRVLVVDDSSVMRTFMKKIFEGSNQFELIGVAPDGKIALDKVATLRPDIVTLDISLHEENGLTILEKLKQDYNMTVVIVSGTVIPGSETYLRAKQLGADDIVSKAAPDQVNGPHIFENNLLNTLKKYIRTKSTEFSPNAESRTSTLSFESDNNFGKSDGMAILAIASSTGGPEALKVLLSNIPSGPFSVVVVQHMTSGFTKTFSKTLNEITQMVVKEAQAGDEIKPGHIFIAPGDQHMEIRRKGKSLYIHLHQAPFMHGVRPAADYLLNSVAQHCGSRAVGVILTGMGKDGAAGMLRLKQCGGFTFAQDEKSCVVFGMPKEAIQLGAINEVHSLQQLGKEVSKQLTRKASRASAEKRVS